MELASTHARIAIELLLNVHALTCLGRGADRESTREEHMRSAAEWMPRIEFQIRQLRRELEVWGGTASAEGNTTE